MLAALGSESKSTTTRDNTDSLAARARLASASSNGAFHATLMMAKSAAAPMAPASGAPKPTAVTMALSVNQAESEDASNTTASSSEDQPEQQSADRQKSSGESSRDQQAALSLEKRATSSLEALKRSVSSTRSHVDASVSAKLDARLAKVSLLVAQGEAAMQSQDYDSAKSSFSQALERSATLSTFIAANARFDRGILGNLLNSNPDDEEGGGE